MNRPYTPISEFYKSVFQGRRAQKIPVTIATDCPNRAGLKNMQTCIFCDEWGSSAYPEQRSQVLKMQIQTKLESMKRKYKSSVFLAYFQAYTSTFMGTKKLQESFDCALSFSEIQGLVIGTRPDCLSPAVFNLWNEYQNKTYVGVELGVQTLYDDDLEFLKRGHSGQCSIDAIKKIKSETSVDLGVHLMFGLPHETNERVIKMAQILSQLRVNNVKLHNLHVLKNTPLEDLYNKGEFKPIELEPYSHRVGLFLQHLDPKIRIQRLCALSSRWEELVSPQWTRHKMQNTQFITDYLNKNQIVQGQNFGAKSLA